MSAAPSQQYLGLVFSEGGVVAALWQQANSRIHIIARSSPIEVQEEKWADAVDASLEQLGSESLSVKKALFAVPAAWTENGELRDEHRELLKTLTTDLLLEPLGFVLLEDTLLAWQEEQLGMSFTGTMITNTTSAWFLQRIEDGKTTTSVEVGKSGKNTVDWQELQARLQALSTDHRRGLYLDFTASGNEYDQIIVKLRQLLQTPVEKIKPDVLAEIALTQGAKEVLQGQDDSASQEPNSAADDSAQLPQGNAPEHVSDEEFRPPSFAQSDTLVSVDETSENEDEDPDPEEDDSEPLEEDPPSKRRLPRFAPLTMLSGIRIPQLRLLKNRRVTIVFGVIVAFLVLLGSAYAWFFTQYTAAINIELESQSLEKTQIMTLAQSASDSAALFVALEPEVVQESITVNKEVPTTGTKITGEPAKGKILLYNKTEDLKNFPAGTRLTTNGKTYTLDNDVQIASASSKENTGSKTIEFGSVETMVTASFIGPEGNIPKEDKFSVANFSSSTYEAVSQEAFTGGSSREIQAVAAADIETAKADLLEDARTQLEQRFAELGTDDQQVFFAGELETLETVSSAQAGAEASIVQVQSTVEGTAYRLNRDKLSQVSQELFATEIQEGYVVQDSSIRLEPQRTIEGTPPQVELKITAKAVPDIQPEVLQQLVAGKYASRAKTLLEETHGVKSATVSLKPAWASSLFPSIPRKAERVKFNLQLK